MGSEKICADALAPEVTLASGIAYAPLGGIATLTCGNGLPHSRDYDLDVSTPAASMGWRP